MYTSHSRPKYNLLLKYRLLEPKNADFAPKSFDIHGGDNAHMKNVWFDQTVPSRNQFVQSRNLFFASILADVELQTFYSVCGGCWKRFG